MLRLNNPESRLLAHIAKMKLGNHHCKKLNSLILEFGEPIIEILEYCTYDDYKEIEQRHIYLNKDLCLNKNASWYIKHVNKNILK